MTAHSTRTKVTPRCRQRHPFAVSLSIISLYQASQTSTTILLRFQVHLLRSPIPKPVRIPSSAFSALSQDSQGYSSYFRLTSLRADHRPRQRRVHALFRPSMTTEDLDKNRLTLYPPSTMNHLPQRSAFDLVSTLHPGIRNRSIQGRMRCRMLQLPLLHCPD